MCPLSFLLKTTHSALIFLCLVNFPPTGSPAQPRQLCAELRTCPPHAHLCPLLSCLLSGPPAPQGLGSSRGTCTLGCVSIQTQATFWLLSDSSACGNHPSRTHCLVLTDSDLDSELLEPRALLLLPCSPTLPVTGERGSNLSF